MCFSYVLNNTQVWWWPECRLKLFTLNFLNILCMMVYWKNISQEPLLLHLYYVNMVLRTWTFWDVTVCCWVFGSWKF